MQADANDPRFHFEANPSLQELLAQQGKGPVQDLAAFRGGWPDDELVEDFLSARRAWRDEAKGSQNDLAA